MALFSEELNREIMDLFLEVLKEDGVDIEDKDNIPELFLKRFNNVGNEIGQDMLESFRESFSEMLEEWEKDKFEFRERLLELWEKPIRLL